jgi:hypothetical protein
MDVFHNKLRPCKQIIKNLLISTGKPNDGMRGVASISIGTFKKLTGVLALSFYLLTLRSNVLLNAMLGIYLFQILV